MHHYEIKITTHDWLTLLACRQKQTNPGIKPIPITEFGTIETTPNAAADADYFSVTKTKALTLTVNKSKLWRIWYPSSFGNTIRANSLNELKY